MVETKIAPATFKYQVSDGVIQIPKEYEEFQNAFVSVSIELEEEDRRDPKKRIKDNIVTLDFSDCMIECFAGVNPIDYQRKIRDGK